MAASHALRDRGTSTVVASGFVLTQAAAGVQGGVNSTRP